MTSVCFDKTYFLIIIIIAVSIVLYNHYNLFQENRNLRASLQLSTDNKINNIQNNQPALSTMNQPIPSPLSHLSTPPPPPSIGQVVRDYDRRTIDDPLTPPFKRDDYMIPSQVIRPDIYGSYTRGAPGVFKKMGYVKTEEVGADYKILSLIGRQKYQGSTQYEYYVTSTNRDDTIKFYIDNVRKELFSGDTITVPQLGTVVYNVYIDKELDLEYNPLMF
jgi:hypothetical protein